MWPTPTTKGFGHASEGQTMIMRKKVEAGELTEEEAQAMMNGTTLRPPRMKQWMWPTPKASGQEKLDTLIKRKGVKSSRATQLNGSRRDVADTNSQRQQEQCRSQSVSKEGDELERSSGEERNGWWDFEPNVGRVAHGVRGRVHRLKGLGNSIVPQIVEEIG